MRDFATKYRPRKWSEVVGQKHVVDVLKSKKDWKALFFQGPPGTGKTTIARLVAMHVNCENPEGIDVCGGSCKYCKAVLSGSLMVDYREENVGDARGIDDIRALVDWLHYKPVFLKKKVVVLDEVHNLTKPAQNLLLKEVEEPAGSVVFVMCTTSPYGVIEPLRQRCQVFVFKPVPDEEMVKLLVRVVEKEGIDLKKLSESQVKEILRKAEGSPRKFLSLLEYVVYGGEIKEVEVEEKRLQGVVECVLKGNVLELIQSYEKALNEVDVRSFVPVLCHILMKKIREAGSYEEVLKYLAVLKGLESSVVYGMTEQDKVLYQLLNATVTMKSLLKV